MYQNYLQIFYVINTKEMNNLSFHKLKILIMAGSRELEMKKEIVRERE